MPGKFSTPYCIAAGFVRGNVGLSDFSDAAVRDPAVVALAGKVRYQIDPKIPIRTNFTGHIRATLSDGRVIEERQPHMRGGAHEPLTRQDIEDKFALNARHGGWSAERAASTLALLRIASMMARSIFHLCGADAGCTVGCRKLGVLRRHWRGNS